MRFLYCRYLYALSLCSLSHNVWILHGETCLPRTGPKHPLAPKLDLIFFILSSLRPGSGFLVMISATLIPFCCNDFRWDNHPCWTWGKELLRCLAHLIGRILLSQNSTYQSTSSLTEQLQYSYWMCVCHKFPEGSRVAFSHWGYT